MRAKKQLGTNALKIGAFMLLLAGTPVMAGVAEKLEEGCRQLLAGRYQAAIATFHAAGQEDARCAEAFTGEAAAYLFQGLYDAAEAYFARALALDPQQAAAHVGAGTLALLRRNYRAAMEHYQQALPCGGPHTADIRASAAHATCLIGLYEAAELEARIALREAPAQELARQVLAAALLARNRAAEALEILSAPVAEDLSAPVGIVAESPLFSPGARYYAERGLEERERLALRSGTGTAATAQPAPPGGVGDTIFSRGDATFHIEWPKPGATLSGRFELAIYAAPELPVQYVAVLLDQQFVGMSNSQPLRLQVDTRIVPDGLREIRVDAYGPTGTIIKSATMLVNIANGQHTYTPDEKAIRQHVNEFLQGLFVPRANVLLRAQLVGHAYEALGRLLEAMEAYEYAFAHDPTLSCLRTDLLLSYQRIGLPDVIRTHEIHRLAQPGAVALTFDDGPHPVLTPRILELLDRYQAKATFFLVGKQAELYPELVREIVQRGHELGSHSHTHGNLGLLSTLGVERELVLSRLAIRQASGVFVTLFRPPGGNYDWQVREAAEHTGFTTVFWNENIMSYGETPAPEILPKMLNRLSDGGIVLLHNGYDQTPELLPLLLPALAERGLKMDTISALTGQRPFRVQNLLSVPLERWAECMQRAEPVS